MNGENGIQADEMMELSGFDGEAEISEDSEKGNSAMDQDYFNDVSGNMIPSESVESDIYERQEQDEYNDVSSGDAGSRHLGGSEN